MFRCCYRRSSLLLGILLLARFSILCSCSLSSLFLLPRCPSLVHSFVPVPLTNFLRSSSFRIFYCS
ncbi:hypothetical protein BT96DRAFT_502520 [Gymnopus androsaceus JB14]|uniref:Uncharacterized protein n=1 Tax=Gymnopus androsaceus JB14 TaxID=1447944 RepID=A0A6A4GMA5_9AGAR|nr:hypothetical protein BT96DRAFT_502520 [Gymnopus androsaceus JB14]